MTHSVQEQLTITDQQFRSLVADRARTLLGLAQLITSCQARQILTRPLLGGLHAQSQQVEELLDSYDARNNCRWCRFRALTAALKTFSAVGYELLHIRHALPAYRLLPIDKDFNEATDRALLFVADILIRTSSQLNEQAAALGVPVKVFHEISHMLEEQLPPGRLARNCMAQRTNTIWETVTLMATAFLNLAGDSKDVMRAADAEPHQYTEYLQSVVKEQTLRNLELRFHNLQSQYDTYVAGTVSERQDEDLLVLRGHISVVFHLFAAATMVAHYYERHAVNQRPCATATAGRTLVEPDGLAALLIRYFIAFIGMYIHAAEDLCKAMLRRYAQVGTIELPVPRYRGFHVRPSTLISRLVLHYGSEVKMYLDDEVYDASNTLDLFRANEKINANKRRLLAKLVSEPGLVNNNVDSKGLDLVVQSVVSELAQHGKIIVYENPLSLSCQDQTDQMPLDAKVVTEVNRLLIQGKIDVDCPMKVRFEGDTRVLADLALLAANGYGEDEKGNNIPLPDRLAFLRR